MEKLWWFILAIWSIIGAIISFAIFVATWVVIAVIVYGVWAFLQGQGF